MSAESGDPCVRATAASLGVFLDETSLTRNEDIWTRTVSDEVFISAYPLAQWFASSWWRLNHEPLPTQGNQPTHEWRMAHELGAANHGFVWPRVVMASDGESMQVWATPLMTPDQSVRYLQGLPAPRSIAIERFQSSVGQFIQDTLSRLDAKELGGSNLAQLWALIQEDQADVESRRRRTLEAQLGFDAEECPADILEAALQWRSRVGEIALSEIAPAIAQSGGNPALAAIGHLATMPGIVAKPEVRFDTIGPPVAGMPWERASHAANSLRAHIGNAAARVSDRELHELLGVSRDQVQSSAPQNVREPVAVAIPDGNGRLMIVPRKRNPRGKRFELARILGEHLREDHETRWLASTDLPTSRQKYQRAFAAEFLCPFSALESYLDGDHSSPAIEDAAEHFDVGELTVQAQLANHGLIAPPQFAASMPYRMAV
ncbi:hypothetical protein CDN99_19965 [Roseateles aquatilis]|uniref:IrrE N-terminal-like domain-containing protein n=2 Tax=Roseateles aquatilis TaxID=431061 RepID=A0A246J307_9BURK|nr:hypothetical protein CDN99_19965 [Roseateles aquatilis]